MPHNETSVAPVESSSKACESYDPHPLAEVCLDWLRRRVDEARFRGGRGCRRLVGSRVDGYDSPRLRGLGGSRIDAILLVARRRCLEGREGGKRCELACAAVRRRVAGVALTNHAREVEVLIQPRHRRHRRVEQIRLPRRQPLQAHNSTQGHISRLSCGAQGPGARVAQDEIFADDGWFAKLRGEGAVDDEAEDPGAFAVADLPTRGGEGGVCCQYCATSLSTTLLALLTSPSPSSPDHPNSPARAASPYSYDAN